MGSDAVGEGLMRHLHAISGYGDHPSLFDLPEPTGPTTMICPHCDGHGVISALAATSRNTDPDTARRAGERNRGNVARFRSDSRKAAVLRALAQSPMTAQQVAIHVLGSEARLSALEGCRRRVSDLKRAGFVVDSGDRARNDGSPDESEVLRVTATGQQAIRNLDATGWSL